MTLTNDNYNETTETHSAAAGTVTINLETSNVHRVEVVDNITFDITGVSQDPAGNSVLIYVVESDGAGPYTLSWPSSVVWDNGVVEGEVSQNGNIEISLLTDNGGTEWRGRKSGGGFE